MTRCLWPIPRRGWWQKLTWRAILGAIVALAGVFTATVVASRPYAAVEDLELVRGISSRTVESLKPYVKVEGETESSGEGDADPVCPL